MSLTELMAMVLGLAVTLSSSKVCLRPNIDLYNLQTKIVNGP